MVKKANFIFLFFSFLFLLSCTEKSTIDVDRLAKLHSIRYLNQSAKEGSSRVDVYIDYSAGMFNLVNDAYQKNPELLKSLFDGYLRGNDRANYYKLGENSKPEKVDKRDHILNNKSSKHYIFNPSNFNDPWTFLRGATKQISSNNHEAILVTDFALDEGGIKINRANCLNNGMVSTTIDNMGWAKPEFKEWIGKGGNIDVFTMVSGDSKLFIICFIPKDKLNETNSTKYLEKEIRNNGEWSINNFSISNQNINVSGDLPDGISSLLLNINETNYSGYSFEKSTLATMLEHSSGKDILLNDLIHNTKDIIAYNNFNYSIEVFDESENIKLLDVASFDSLDFKASQNVTEKEVFLLDEVEGALSIRVLLDNTNTLADEELYRVDVYIEGASFNFPIGLENDLIWKHNLRYNNCLPIKSLHSSISNAMKELDIKKELLYTYYIHLK